MTHIIADYVWPTFKHLWGWRTAKPLHPSTHISIQRWIIVHQELKIGVESPPTRSGRGVSGVRSLDIPVLEGIVRLKQGLHAHLPRHGHANPNIRVTLSMLRLTPPTPTPRQSDLRYHQNILVLLTYYDTLGIMMYIYYIYVWALWKINELLNVLRGGWMIPWY